MFREDKRHGHGNFIWPDGAAYEGYVDVLSSLYTNGNIYQLVNMITLPRVLSCVAHFVPYLDSKQ